MTEAPTETEAPSKADQRKAIIREYRLAHPGYTLKAIAAEVGCTHEYVRQVLNAAKLPTKADPHAEKAVELWHSLGIDGRDESYAIEADLRENVGHRAADSFRAKFVELEQADGQTSSVPEPPPETEPTDEQPPGHWSYAALVDGQATGWEGEYATRDEAREAAAAVYDEFVTGRLERKRYADLLPPMHALLNEVKEHAAEHGADTSSFEGLDGHDYRLLQVLVEDTLKHWEAAVVERAPEKACSVRVVDHVQRHPAE